MWHHLSHRVPQSMTPPKPTFDPGLTQTFTGRLRQSINPDGTFNVKRRGTHIRDSGYFLYFMNLSWPAFLVQMPLIYLGIEFFFAIAYYAVGVEHLQGAPRGSAIDEFMGAFFFSIQTFTTVGYGHIAPVGTLASSVAAVEAMSGILSLAVATGLIFARFSKPSAKIAFSDNALMAPHQGGTALMFRLANRRPNILMELEATVLLMTVERLDGELKRKFSRLPLERDTVYFMPLSWTLVHTVDEASPLYGKTAADLEELQAEFLIVVKCFDDTFSQTVHARRSYPHEHVVWGARFQPTFRIDEQGDLELDLNKLNHHGPA